MQNRNQTDIDITELEDFRAKLTDSISGDKIKITPLAFIAKALTNNLKKFPTFMPKLILPAN